MSVKKWVNQKMPYIFFVSRPRGDHVSLKLEIVLEQREVAFLSRSKICKNLDFSTEIQIFANFSG